MIKNIIAGFTAGLIATGGILGISSITKEDIEPTTEPIQTIQGDQGTQGEMGVRGYTGTDGTDGTDGVNGEDGTKGDKGEKGDSVTVGEVLAAIAAQEAIVEVDYSLTGNGSGTATVVSLPVGTYSISIVHVGSEYFGASLNGNGVNTIFVSQNGYVSTEDAITITTEGDYTINVTAEGQWSFNITKD